jgi:hypothetical protein
VVKSNKLGTTWIILFSISALLNLLLIFSVFAGFNLILSLFPFIALSILILCFVLLIRLFNLNIGKILKLFLLLTLFGEIGFFLFAIFHNIFYAFAILTQSIYIIALFMEILEVVSFLLSIIVSPLVFLIGLIGLIVIHLKK